MTVEELQIIISAKTEKVQAKIAAVKEKIAGLQPKKAADVDVSTNKAQGNLKKLQAEIDRTQAKIQKLAEKQNAVQSEIDARAGMYSAVPNFTGMGHEETVGTLMDRDPKIQKLTEQMSALDAQTAPLKTHLAETKAQIAAAGNAAEPAAAKTRQLGESMKNAGHSIQSAGNSSSYFGRMTSRMLLSMLLYQGVSSIFKSISEGVQNMALGNAQANSTMSQLATSALYLKNSIAAALMPALQALTPVIVQIADGIAWAANQIAIFIAQVAGQKTVTIAKKSYVDYAKSLDKAGDSASGANKKVKELQRTIMGFDELNVLQKNVDDAGGSGKKSNTPDYGSMFETIKTPPSTFNKSNLQKVFDSLKDGAEKAQKSLDKIKNKATEASKELSKVKLPELGSWKIPVFPPVRVPAIDTSGYDKSKQKYQQPVHAPAFVPVAAPAIILANFLKNKAEYLAKISAPTITVAVAPAIILADFMKSKATYQSPVTAPAIKQAFAPALNLASKFEPSIEAAKKDIINFSTNAQKTVISLGINLSSSFGKTWSSILANTSKSLSGMQATAKTWGSSFSTAFSKVGTNVMSNVRSTFAYIPKAVAGGLNATGTGVSKWLASVSAGFANFGSNIVSNIGKTMSAWYTNFVSGLSAAWDQFTSFMKGTGKSISNWWSANKSWAAPVAVGLAVTGAAIAVIATGGAALPAVAALAPVGLATGGLVTGPTYSLIGEGTDNEAVLPLNSDVYSQLAKGIRENGNSDISKEALELLYSIDNSLKQGHSINVRMDVDGKPFVNKVIKEIDNRDKRYHPVRNS